MEAAEERRRATEVPIGRLGTDRGDRGRRGVPLLGAGELHHRRGAAGRRRTDCAHLMLGLPDGIRACLFDLDGVLTQTAKVHAAAWKQMFDEYLQLARPSPSSEFTPGRLRRLRGRQAAPGRRALVPRSRAGSSSRGADDRRLRRRARRPQERPRAAPDPRARRRGLRGLGRATSRPARDAGLRRAVVSSSANTRDVLRVDRHRGPLRGGRRRRGRRARAASRASPRPDTFLAAARDAGRRARRRRRCSRTRWPASRPAAPATSAASSASTGSATPTRCARTAPTSSSRTSPSCSSAADARRPSDEPHPWEIRESELDLDLLAQRESVFALSNGHIGLRGTLDEGEPHGLPGTYLNGVYETRPLPYAEAGYGFPEDGQTVVNVTNGKLIRLLVDDEPFDVRYGELLSHRRVLDMRAGTLEREVEWRSPAGQAVRVRSVRLVSLVQRAVAAILWEVEPIDEPARIVVQSELVANEAQPAPASRGPARGGGAARAARAASSARRTTTARDRWCTARAPAGCWSARRWTTSSRRRRRRRDRVRGRGRPRPRDDRSRPRAGRAAAARQAARLRLVGHALAAGGARPGRGRAGRGAAHGLGRPGRRPARDARRLLGGAPTWSSTATWRSSRRCASASSTRMQAGARAERRAIPAKGLTGPGYDGHAFWDTETFVLPLLTYTAPHAAAAALRWRHSILPLARERARTLDLRGAAFPWRTIARRGVLGLLAGRHRGVPRVGRRGRRGAPLRAGHRRRRLRARRRRSSCWWRPRGCGARSATTTRRRLSHRRRDRARRVQRRSRTTTSTRT